MPGPTGDDDHPQVEDLAADPGLGDPPLHVHPLAGQGVDEFRSFPSVLDPPDGPRVVEPDLARLADDLNRRDCQEPSRVHRQGDHTRGRRPVRELDEHPTYPRLAHPMTEFFEHSDRPDRLGTGDAVRGELGVTSRLVEHDLDVRRVIQDDVPGAGRALAVDEAEQLAEAEEPLPREPYATSVEGEASRVGSGDPGGSFPVLDVGPEGDQGLLDLEIPTGRFEPQAAALLQHPFSRLASPAA